MGFSTITRLFVANDLVTGQAFALSEPQSHYLLSVMRLDQGSQVRVFNGRDGEFLCQLQRLGKRDVQLVPVNQTNPQKSGPDLWIVAAPIKKLDSLAQKVSEVGASDLFPVVTQYSQAHRLKESRLQANLLEGAEQCDRLDVPKLHEAKSLPELLAEWPADRLLIFCDETGQGQSPQVFFNDFPKSTKAAILIGPEGGFSEKEREALRSHPHSRALTLGPRTLRADTALVAAASLWQSFCGDWGM